LVSTLLTVHLFTPPVSTIFPSGRVFTLFLSDFQKPFSRRPVLGRPSQPFFFGVCLPPLSARRTIHFNLLIYLTSKLLAADGRIKPPFTLPHLTPSTRIFSVFPTHLPPRLFVSTSPVSRSPGFLSHGPLFTIS